MRAFCALGNSVNRISCLAPKTLMEIYVSTDVETDGPIPGPNSMLSFGSAAFTASKDLLGTFTANLETLARRRNPTQRQCNGGHNNRKPGPLAGRIS